MRIKEDAIRASQWADNGPGWVAVMLSSRAEVLALQPDYPALAALKVGVVGGRTITCVKGKLELASGD